MHKWMMTTCAAAVLAALAGCNSGSSNDDDATETPPSPPAPPAVVTPESVSLSLLGRYSSGEFGVSAAEIPAFDPVNQHIFVVNALNGAVDILDARDLANPVFIETLTVDDIASGAVVNSIAYRDGLLAVAIEASPKTDPGFAAIYDATSLERLSLTQVGAQPDMLTFSPDGRYLLVANEGEPSDDYAVDPEGSVSIIALNGSDITRISTARFSAFNSQKQALLDSGVRIFGPNASVAQDMEPEYITVSADSTTAWIALQENNALAKLDIASGNFTDILPLGYKDHGVAGNGIDASDTEGEINIRTWPGVVGMYHPDSISSYSVDGKTYIVTANEGDARAWGEDNQAYWDGDASQGFVEEIRLKHLVHRSGFNRRVGDDMPPQLNALAAGALLNPDVFGYCGASAGEPGDCREDDLLGRLSVSWVNGYRKDQNGDPLMFDTSGNINPAGDRIMYDQIYAFGARSFAIWDEDGSLVWDSADQIEQFIAVGQGPNDHVTPIVRAQLGRHRLEAAAMEHIEEEGLDDVIAVMAQRQTVRANLVGIGIQIAAAQARTQGTGGFALWNLVHHDRVGIALEDVVLHAQRLKVGRQNLLGEAWLLLIKVDRHQFKANRRDFLQVQQHVQHGVAVFATRQANHHLVAVLDHVVIRDRLSGQTTQAFLQLVLVDTQAGHGNSGVKNRYFSRKCAR